MGIQINGATDSITAIDGTIDVVSAIGNAGVVTATAFVGNITGNVTGNINHASNLELQVGGVTRGNFDSSGRLLIGTTTAGHSTADNLTIASSGSGGISIRADAGYASNIHFADGTTGDDQYRGIIQYHHNGDSMRFFTNATEKLRINSAGKVGIGTDEFYDNSTKLEVRGRINTVGSASTGSINTGNGTVVNMGSLTPHDLQVITGNSTRMTIKSGTGEALRIDSAGRIGIGTATLDSSADVSITNASSSARIYMKSADNADCSIYFGSMNDAATGAIRYDHSDDSLRFYGYNNGEYARILDGALLVNRTAKYASSSEKLSVNGMTSIQYASTSAAGLYVFNTDTTGSGTVQPFIFLHDGNGIRGGLGLQYSTSNFIINANNVIQFRTGSSGVGGTEKMRLTSTGQLSIGEANPSSDVTFTVRKDVAAASGNASIQINNLYQGTANASNQSGAEIEFKFKNHNASHNWWGGRILCSNTDNYNQYTNLQFHTASQGNAVVRMRLDHDGDLNIFGKDNAELKLKCGTSTGNNIIAFQNSGGTTRGNITYDSDDNFLFFNVNQGEKARITSTGFLGINESDPQQLLHVHNDTNYQGILINGNGAPRIAFARTTTTTGEWSVGIDGTNGNQFVINNSNDNSNRKVIVSSSGLTAAGTITSGGNATFNGVVTFNGSYQQGNASAGLALFGSSAMSRGVVISHGANNLRPTHNNDVDLGTSGQRFKTIYSNNSLNTSDKNLKNTIVDSDLGLSFINKLRPVSFKWNQKNEESLDTKTHYGLIAQEIETALISEGKTLNDFAGVFKPDDYKDDGTGGAMGVSLNEIISPLIKAIQELSAKVAALEGS